MSNCEGWSIGDLRFPEQTVWPQDRSKTVLCVLSRALAVFVLSEE